ncbi:DMT family transporter [Aureispira sp. CCB-QB1]|uniref:DMT family transporter n=1 Tax=Aureispira sp. CCB-QB1 TaxID=1313421 RepID=UPI0006978DF7|nr:DMT family transporter [Aureispira sp. CCB-QB1]
MPTAPDANSYPPKTHAYLSIHIAVLLFGGAGLFGKLIDLPAGSIVLGRACLGALFVYFFSQLSNFYPSQSSVRVQQFRPQSTQDFIVFCLLGIILAFHWVAFFEAIQNSSVAIGVLTFSTFPIFTTLLEPFLNHEPLKATNLLLAFIVFIGVALVLPDFDYNNRYTQGALWGIASGASFAVLTLLSKRMLKGYTSNCVSFYQNGIAAIFLMPFFALDIFEGTTQDWLYLLLLGIIFTAIAHTLFIHSMQALKARTASLIASLEPLYAILLAWLFLGESPSLYVYLGGSIILAVTLYVMIKNQ